MQNLIEYYDELFPVTESALNFMNVLAEQFSSPAKFLEIGSATGSFCIQLAKSQNDVTGIEVSKPLLDSALLKSRNQLLSMRFFKLSTSEMGSFLGKDFYNVIFSLNNRISFIPQKEKMQSFFCTVKEMLSKNGILVLQILNYEYFLKTNAEIPQKSSIRVSLSTTLNKLPDGIFESQNIKTGSGKTLPIITSARVYPLTKQEIKQFATNAGFSSVEFYSDFNRSPIQEDSPYIICKIS